MAMMVAGKATVALRQTEKPMRFYVPALRWKTVKFAVMND